MISSEVKNGARRIDIQGTTEEILEDYMHLIGGFIVGFRSHGIPDSEIEKQLVRCIAGGFAIADDLKKGVKRQ